ncbi:MAG: hypothetical protein K2Y51_12205 [Gammaproteobacteria bacterium]|nr:hypothetical protein [Gammaproteobacteria bacterium]
MSASANVYAGERVALLTRHGKHAQIAPALEQALGCRVELVDSFDTDTLGTFTREVARAGTQRDAARRKAEIGMELVGARCGVASEGAFGADPFGGLLGWNVELVLWVDLVRGLEVAGWAQAPARLVQETVQSQAALEALAREAGFPDHGLVLRPEHEAHPRIVKDCQSWPALREAFVALRDEARGGAVFVESDLRAHRNPARREVIALAAADLARRLAVACPRCAAPGYGVVDGLRGLPCGWCGAPTSQLRGERFGCALCGHGEDRLWPEATQADPGNCARCNP